jgi:predicted site-specific integrase-resolvase
MKLSEWAKRNGLTYQTAHRLFKANKLPAEGRQLATGTILIDDNDSYQKVNLKTYIYSRVSSPTKKEDLQRQAERCSKFAEANGWEIEKVIKEVGSGMNDNRKKLNSLIDKEPKRIIVEHKDRLTRFGFNYLERTLTLLNYELIVINRDQENEADLMKDLVAIITSFCCRLYGLRRGKTKTKEIKEQILIK